MAEYFYTVDLGQTYGPKLQKLAAETSCEDVEAFAAMLLCRAVDWLEQDLADAAAWEEAEKEFLPGHDLDDGIPF